MSRNICLIFILLIFAVVLKAQDKQITILPPFKEGEIVIEKKKGFSLLQMRPSFIESSESGKYNLFFVALFSRADKFPKEVPLVTLAFYSNSKECKFPDSTEAKSEILIDNQIFVLGNPLEIEDKKEVLEEGVGFGTYNEPTSDGCNGMFTMQLPRKIFIKFITAKKVQVKINEYKFELKPNNIKSLSSFAKLLIPKKK